MKKIILLLVILTTLVSMFSCKRKNNGQNGSDNSGDGGNSESSTPSGEYIYTSGSDLTLVFPAGMLTEENSLSIMNSLPYANCRIADDDTPTEEHEIVFGLSVRDISEEAYRRLGM